MKSDFRKFLLNEVLKIKKNFELPKIVYVHVYGGSASYQWVPGADIDVSIHIDWTGMDYQLYDALFEKFKNIEIPYEGYKTHFFLRESNSNMVEASEMVYDVVDDKWIIPPIKLASEYDPYETFEPFINYAKGLAKKIDVALGQLRQNYSLYKRTKLQYETVENKNVANKKLEDYYKAIKKLTRKLAHEFSVLKENRNALHQRVSKGEAFRFSVEEVVWKYLDNTGYLDILYNIKKWVDQENTKSTH
jgi:predicted nucleotidyltransferase